MFICAGHIESFPFAKPIGIGLIQSAIGLTQLILSENPRELIFIGTAGSYDPAIELLSIHESTRAAQIELSYLERRSYTPLENVIAVEQESDNVSCETAPLIVNSSNYITTDSHLSLRFPPLGIALENMEFYAVLEVAKRFHLSAQGIFCVTNYTDSSAHESFKRHHAHALQALESYVKEHYAQYL